MHAVPSKQATCRILEMFQAGLVSWKHLQPWASDLIAGTDEPPPWICELLSLTYKGDIERCLGEYVWSPPFEPFDHGALGDYAVSCLLVRFERRELSWGTVLDLAGNLVDCRDTGVRSCEWYYAMLNELEDCEYDPDIEERQVAEVRKLLAPSIAQVLQDFQPFVIAFRKGVAIRKSD